MLKGKHQTSPQTMDTPSLRINTTIEHENAMVIACFPSVGMVSSIVAHYLIDHLDLEFVGGLVDDRLPALAMIHEGMPLPPIRAYAGRPKCSIEVRPGEFFWMSEMVVPESLVHKIVWSLFTNGPGTGAGGRCRRRLPPRRYEKRMDGVEPVVEYEDTEGIDVVGIDATRRFEPCSTIWASAARNGRHPGHERRYPQRSLPSRARGPCRSWWRPTSFPGCEPLRQIEKTQHAAADHRFASRASSPKQNCSKRRFRRSWSQAGGPAKPSSSSNAMLYG